MKKSFHFYQQKTFQNLYEKKTAFIKQNWLIIMLICFSSATAQIQINAEALVSPASKTITISQEINYRNTSKDELKEFYLLDWNNAFKDKNSPLGKQFSSVYIRRFHFSESSQRGETRVDFIKNNQKNITWIRPRNNPDIIKIPLEKNISPGENTSFQLQYTLRIPDDIYTNFGVNYLRDFHIKHWLIIPAVYDGKWNFYNHKNLNDEFFPLSDIDIKLKIPQEYQVYSGMNQTEIKTNSFHKEVRLQAKKYNHFDLSITAQDIFDVYKYRNIKVFSNIKEKSLSDSIKQHTVERILNFLNESLGDYPHQQLLITEAEYKSSPIYGLNQLPDFVRLFSNQFQYDLKMMKTITKKYLSTSFQINKRKNEWILNALQTYLLMDYIEKYYPDQKLIGNLSDVIGLRWTHLAKMNFNERYQYFFMNMNRLNLDQALSESKDFLLKFNQEIANPFKAGIGLKYLEDFIGKENLDNSIQNFYQTYQKRKVKIEDFERTLKNYSPKNINWFFEEYVKTNKRINFKIKKVKQIGDSLKIKIKNKENNSMPISLYGINKKNKEIISKTWIENTKNISEITIPKKEITQLALNYEKIIPEFNQRNNYKNLKSPFNKPLEFRLFKDVENSRYTQFFIMPEFSYNVYDGFVLGSQISNEAILAKNLTYSFTPQYGFKSRNILGKVNFLYNQQFRNQNLSNIAYGFVGHRYSYAENAFYHRFSPYITLSWRHRDLKNKERQHLSFRNVYVHRDQSKEIDLSDQPNYNVFNARYVYSNKNLIENYSALVDYQIGKKFSKISFRTKYRKLFLNNKQLEFRLFAGAFLYNKTQSDYFSFGLDRPTDYMFDYNYYGRSESSGFFSQQFIESEGGFKSRLAPHFANSWIAAFNTSASFYKDILFVYGDFATIKNKEKAFKLRYDSGIRLSLVQDYFEVFFPVYSNQGWEITQKHYEQKIRFIISLDVETLMGLFRRTYY